MQGDRERAESNNSGGPFGGFGPQRSIMSSIFGGRDPFFTRPFNSMFGSSMFNSGSPFRDSPQISSSKGPIIEELHFDEEEEEEFDDPSAKEGTGISKKQKHTESNKQPHVEHPDDEADDAEKKCKDLAYRSDYNKVEGTNPQARSVSFQKVTYGGINGPYYSATTTRRTGSDGVVLEECKQADRTTGQAEHRISRGMHDKGHSVTRKLNSDGKVDTNQTLHNLNEDELAGFDQAWRGAERHFPAWDVGFAFNGTPGGWASGNSLAPPFEGFSGRTGRMGADNDPRMPPTGGRPKKVVTINIE